MGLNRNRDVNFVDLKGGEYLDALKEKVNSYRAYCSASGQVNRWSLSIANYYGVSPDGKNSWRVTPGGEFGELVQLKVNDYASLVRHQVVLAIQSRPAGMAKAINSDVETLRNARIGTQLVEYYLSDPSHQFERDYVQALQLSLLTSESFVVQDWDTALGSDMAGDESGQKAIKTGDIAQCVFPTWNVARDLGAPKAQDLPWYILSERVNKFELAAKYPAFKDAILLDADNQSAGISKPPIFRPDTDNTDYIELHKLVYFPSAASEQGRYTLFISDEILLDVPYPYKFKNVHRCYSDELIQTCFAHTANYDLLALEQVTDTLNSVAVNALSTFGVATIVGPKGGGIAHQELAKGLRYLEVEPQFVDKIKALDLAKIPDALMPVLQAFNIKKGELSGINSILRGDPQGQLKGASGSAMALLQSQAITYNSANQFSFYRLLSSAGTGIIEMVRQFSDEPRIVRIAGKANQQSIKEFKVDTETLASVSTVVFEPINPVLQTAAGKLSVAQDLLQAGMLSDPNDYVEVLTTGNLSVVTNKSVTLKEAVVEENEQLAEGVPVQAVITENHQKHIDSHQVVISMPDSKKNPQIVQNVLSHIQQHLDLWRQASDTNPALLAATGQQVLPPLPPPGMPPGIGMPPQQGQAPQGPVPPPPGPDQTNAPQPNLPQPPKNPATGERAPVAPGTSVS